MSAPRRDDNKIGDDPIDEEAARTASPPPLPREISYKRPRDDDTLPSELSRLIAPSTLTSPQDCCNNPECHRHPHSDSLGSSSRNSDTRVAFQWAAMLGMLSLGLVLGVDIVYMMALAEDHDSNMKFDAGVDSPLNDGIWSAKDWPTGALEQTSGNGRITTNVKAKVKKDKAGKKGAERYEIDVDESPVDDVELGWDLKLDVNYNDDDVAAPKLLIPNDADGGGGGNSRDVPVPEAYERCPYVVQTFEDLNKGVMDMGFLREKYIAQSVDANVFYRATALLFWKDFGNGRWGSEQGKSINLDDLVLLKDAKYDDGTPMSLKSTWTWITGDQHLSNFGAWRNRGGYVVFSVNDFDEAAIFDFHIDVLRVAVSICNHGFTNGFVEDDVRDALEAFTYTYVKTAIDYVGGDADMLFELDAQTSTGVLRDFLRDVESDMSLATQMHKFTELGSDGMRRFTRNDYTRLEDVPPHIEKKIRDEITSTRYGASMMHMGWKVRGWDDDFFKVLDVAQRVGSGIGSYGVDRYYVLLKGEGMLIDEDEGVLTSSVILDVKYEPVSAVSRILEEVDFFDPDVKSWYKYLFRNEADRAAQAQRRLTSYTDPYVGYLNIDGDSYIVRQRSPYKSSFDVSTLTYPRAFSEFVEQIAKETATALGIAVDDGGVM
ncbi:hypothetical protein ACHAXA_004438 [Cyclostephanos tholiformis]|uniref:Uncharacterized protein n=1 Tax=Cyclostephanos tholiformis TaxID=382380 RepID=A0ABD3SC15_9STRA